MMMLRSLSWVLLILVLGLTVAFTSTAQEDNLQMEEFSWSEPEVREDGTPMSPDEIGGYEFRYYEDGGEEWLAFVIYREGVPVTGHEFLVPPGEHKFTVAVFDTNGLYSQFIEITETIEPDPNPPNPVLEFRRSTVRDTPENPGDCLERVECTVVDRQL